MRIIEPYIAVRDKELLEINREELTKEETLRLTSQAELAVLCPKIWYFPHTQENLELLRKLGLKEDSGAENNPKAVSD